MSEEKDEPKHKQPAKKVKLRMPKPVRNIAISVIVLLVLLVAGGFAYTWFLGGGASSNTILGSSPAATTATSYQQVTPVQPKANAQEGVAVEVVDSPVARGSDTSITVSTDATSKCTILVTYDNIVSTAAGLGPTAANDYGTASWTWRVGSSTPLGTWPIKVTCVYHKRSAVVDSTLQVTD